ncbi:hypothetical protein [Synoicihabitans lomoniglobus]|uniref:Uncharacterized protein n=1 Tax=Synoicihabitans lomoniglobus TaxID=2909285 RepID=A0AAE9ZS53_9BACT|nr:hypothetical protein [Opitutaceae bacterium LMO-M01]WED63241.1 hypothetical protein PXH66_12965 [Opitutaceae bacterium LMO-M01]
MNFEEMQSAWQQSAAREPLPLIDDAVVRHVRADSRKFSHRIFWRDVREVAACFLVTFIFGRMALAAEAEGAPAWPLWVAAIIPLGVAAYFAIDRLIMHRRATPRGETVLTEIDRAADEVRHQIWLLRNVLWWYLLPLGTSTVMITLQYFLYGPAYTPLIVKVIMGALVVGVAGGFNFWVWKLNQKAVRKDLQPRLAELENRRRELSGEA